MCIVKTPKLSTSSTDTPKEPTVVRNPYLDGTGPTARAQRQGRSSLRIVRAKNAPRPSTTNPSPTAPPIMTGSGGRTPVAGGGGSVTVGGGGGGRINRGINIHAY